MFLIGSAIVSIGGMLGASGLDQQSASLAKHACFAAFVGGQGAAMLPIVFLAGPVVAQAASATALMVGSLSAVAAVAPSDSFLWMGGGLTIGLGVVVASSLGRIFFPASSLLLNISLYGGLSLFGGMTLYDTQRIAKHARELPATRFDPMRESISLYLNTINIFIRMVQIFGGGGGNNNRRRR
jgi:FtsH-binding integral membrane protein